MINLKLANTVLSGLILTAGLNVFAGTGDVGSAGNSTDEGFLSQLCVSAGLCESTQAKVQRLASEKALCASYEVATDKCSTVISNLKQVDEVKKSFRTSLEQMKKDKLLNRRMYDTLHVKDQSFYSSNETYWGQGKSGLSTLPGADIAFVNERAGLTMCEMLNGTVTECVPDNKLFAGKIQYKQLNDQTIESAEDLLKSKAFWSGLARMNMDGYKIMRLEMKLTNPKGEFDYADYTLSIEGQNSQRQRLYKDLTWNVGMFAFGPHTHGLLRQLGH